MGKKKGRKKKQKISVYRKVHTWIGLAASVFLVTLSISGIYLNHQEKLHQPESSTILKSALVSSQENTVLVATPQGLFLRQNQTETKLYLPYSLAKTTALSVDDDRVYIAFKGGILMTGTLSVPHAWKQIPLADNSYLITSIDSDSGRLLIETDTGHYRYRDAAWDTLYKTVPSLKTWMVKLHNGYLWGNALVYFNDLSAVILILLVITGIIIFIRSLRK